MAEPRDEALRRHYRELATEEASVAIDDAIRAAARRAVSSAPGGVRKSASRRWALPVSIAAVVFLSFGVVMRMEQEVPTLDAEMRAAPATSSPMTPSVGSPPVPQVMPEERPEAQLQAKAKEDGQKKRVEAEVIVSTQTAPAPKPEPAPRALAKDLSAALAEDSRAQESTRANAVPAPGVVPAFTFAPPPPAPTAPAAAAAPVPAPAAAAPAAPLADAMTRQVAPASPQNAAAPAAIREERNVAQSRRDGAAAGSLSVGAATGPARAKAEAGGARPEAFAAKKSVEAVTIDLAAAPWPDTPERKLERIEALRKAGRDREADEGIARFKREHPDYRIPEDVWSRIKPR